MPVQEGPFQRFTGVQWPAVGVEPFRARAYKQYDFTAPFDNVTTLLFEIFCFGDVTGIVESVRTLWTHETRNIAGVSGAGQVFSTDSSYSDGCGTVSTPDGYSRISWSPPLDIDTPGTDGFGTLTEFIVYDGAPQTSNVLFASALVSLCDSSTVGARPITRDEYYDVD